MSCSITDLTIAEISIPDPVNTTNASALKRPTFIQNCADPFAGATYQVQGGGNGPGVGGIVVNGSQLLVQSYIRYDAGYEQNASLFVKPTLNLATANASGPYAIAQQGVQTNGTVGFTSGPMAWIPPEWRPVFGNNSLVAWNGGLSIGSRTSYGPAAFAFNPNNLGSVSPNPSIYPASPAPSLPLLYYDNVHQTIGDAVTQYDGVNIFYNPVVVPALRGMVIPNGTRSALYFTGVGRGPVVYKGPVDCVSDGSGYSGFPYTSMIQAYDLNNWANTAADPVANPPWASKPYAAWHLDNIPFTDGQCDASSGGVAYDDATRTIYWASAQHDPLTQYSAGLIFHAWRLK